MNYAGMTNWKYFLRLHGRPDVSCTFCEYKGRCETFQVRRYDADEDTDSDDEDEDDDAYWDESDESDDDDETRKKKAEARERAEARAFARMDRRRGELYREYNLHRSKAGRNPGYGDPCGLRFATEVKNLSLNWDLDQVDIDGFLHPFYPLPTTSRKK
jgi:hypothetical protein